jgi:hypothetical protein
MIMNGQAKYRRSEYDQTGLADVGLISCTQALRADQEQQS